MRSRPRPIALLVPMLLLGACQAVEQPASERQTRRSATLEQEGGDDGATSPSGPSRPPGAGSIGEDEAAGGTQGTSTATDGEASATSTSTEVSGTNTSTGLDATDTEASTGSDVDPEVIALADVAADDSLTYDDFAQEFLDIWCVSCHGAQNGSAVGMRLDVYDDVDDVEGAFSKRDRIAARVADNTMPPGSKPSREDREALIAWVKAGAPESPPSFEVAVLEPNAVEEAPTADSFSVQLSFADAASTATWSLYYTQTSGDQSNGIPIITGQPVATTSYAWDTSGVADATYYLYVVASSSGVTLKASSVGTVKVVNAANAAPSIALAGGFQTATTAGFVDASGGSVVITYSVSDSDGDTVGLKIERSSNGGATYTDLVVDGHTHATTYTWSTPTSGDLVNQRIRITASDGRGGVATVASPVYVMSTNAYTYTGDIGSLLTTQCASCHPNGNPAGTPYDPGTYSSVFTNRSLVQSKSVDGGMGGLSMAEKNKLLVWIKRGAPQ